MWQARAAAGIGRSLRRRGLAVTDVTRACSPAPASFAGSVTAGPDDAKPEVANCASAPQTFLASRPALYWKLAKGKLTVWVSISALPGYLLAVPGALDPVTLAALTTGTFLTSAAAQTMNQLYEVKRDALMKRTCQRPLPTGKVKPEEAVAFSAACGSLGLTALAAGANPATAVISATTIATYVAAYTPLKVVTPYNTHVGAISGALPVLLGFTAALGSGLASSVWLPHALWLFTMQVLWQMPHFYALAWLHRADYLRGGYNMFPLTDATGHATAAMSKPYLVALCTMPWVLSGFGLASWMLPIGAFLPSAFWWRALKTFERKPSSATCRRFFLGSLSYLLAMLGLFTAFARPERPQSQAVWLESIFCPTTPTEEGRATRDEDTTAAPRGPLWRSKVHEFFVELCPHELVKSELFGVGRDTCPLSREE